MPGRKKKMAKEEKKPSFRDNQKAFLCTVNGTREINIENYGTLGDFSENKIVLNCYKCKMIIEGDHLRIEYFTDVDMRIIGRIHSIHF